MVDSKDDGLIRTTFNNINNRLKNPFLFSFIMSFIICNWQAFSVFIFAQIEIQSKLQKTLEYFSWYTGFFIPIMIAVFYVIGLPLINAYFEKIQLHADKIYNDNLAIKEELKQKRLKKQLMNELENEQIKQQIKSEINKDIVSIRQELEKINNTINYYRDSWREYDSEYQKNKR